MRAASATAPNAVTKYYYSGGQRVAVREPDGEVNWLHGDHLGSTSLATGVDGQQVSRQLYYPFGEVYWASADMPTDFGYTGQRLDGTGLMFYHARYYDPYLNRFIQADTIVPNPGDPQDFNRYSYVRNNPLRYTYPSGHWYYDPGCQCLVKTKDPTHENAIDPVSTGHHSGSRYFNYDETPESNPTGQFYRPGTGGASNLLSVSPDVVIRSTNYLIRRNRIASRGAGFLTSTFVAALPEFTEGAGWRIDGSAVAIVGVDGNLELLCTFDSGSCIATATGSAQFDVVGGGAGLTMGPILAVPYDSEIPPLTVGVDMPVPLPVPFSTVGEFDVTFTSGRAVYYVGAGPGAGVEVYTAVPIESLEWLPPEIVNQLFRYYFGLE